MYLRRAVQVVVVPLVLAVAAGVAPATPNSSKPKPPDPVGLSLFFQNGTAQSIDLVGDASRYLQEIDLTTTVTTTTDQGITPLIHHPDLAHLDWRGVKFVEEDFRAPGDGTYTRQRFYRGAKWMGHDSTFVAIPKDARGRLAGDPMVFLAGQDNDWNESDDGFVRRYDVRQITMGCTSPTDCSHATTFIAQALVQSRQNLHADRRAAKISAKATQLSLVWSEDNCTNRSVTLTHSKPTDHTYGYGFEPVVEVLTQPANGQYFLPGDTVSFRITFKDGAGNRLNPPGSLPTYGEFMAGTSAGGLRFLDLGISPTLYYALKHREGNMLFALSGPTSQFKNPFNTIDISEFFGPQVTVARAASEGWSGVAEVIPPLPEIIGGFQDPSLWELPNSDVQSLTIPMDAQPGTYIAAIKARREWGGEALNRGATASLQVGSRTATSYVATTGHCNNCHQDRSSLGIVNHGLGDRTACFGCHASLSFEPDNALDIRVHFVHSRSNRFPGNVNDCSNCHLSPPQGPARGFPGVGF
ncbi:MAG TPA: hypothetical protein VER96_40400 [Polyangiaceae bacterium]|nr:hypothetical protein [Polyangiaceae bacterium]